MQGLLENIVKKFEKSYRSQCQIWTRFKKTPMKNSLILLLSSQILTFIYTIGSTVDGNLQSGVEESTNEDSDSDQDSSVSERSTSTAPSAPTPAKKKRSNVSEVLDVLKEHYKCTKCQTTGKQSTAEGNA
jgi:hypothetical protein